MIKKKLFRFGSVFMCAALMACSLAACGTNTSSIKQDAVIESQAAGNNSQTTISDAISNQFSNVFSKNSSQSSENSKEEIVYVFTDANGKQDHLTVNEKLNNVTNASSITDVSTLSNIQNLTGEEKSTGGENNSLTWAANGNSITYQGTTSKQTPVTMKVTYKLDGKDISAKDLAGKSGKVTIHYDYTNNEKKTIDVNGTTKTVYVPFTMITGLLLPTDKFSNIEVTNGKVVEANDGVVAMGVTVPGLKDSLKIQLGDENLDLDIPESFEVTADVNDFELDMAMSVASSTLLSDVNLDSLNMDSVQDDVDTLTDASDQLVDGTQTLSDNLSLLNDNVPDLTDGVSTLDNAATALQDATAKLADGAATIQSGASDYTDAVSQLADGSNDLVDGTSQAVDGINALSDTVKKEMVPGAKLLVDGLSDLHGGIDRLAATLNKSFGDINTEAGTYSGKVEAALSQADSIQTLGAVVEPTLSGISSALGGINLSVTPHTDLSALAADPDNLEANAAALLTKYITAYTTVVTAKSQGSTAFSTVDATIQGATAGSAVEMHNINEVYTSEIGLLLKVVGNGSVSTALNKVYNTATTQKDAQTGMNLSQSLAYMSNGSKQLYDGAVKLQAGIGSFEDTAPAKETLCSALFKLQAGGSSLKSGSQSINGYLTTLAGKNDTLNGGLSTLADGTSQLADKSVELKDGTSTLNDAAVTLGDAVGQLSEGAITLKDGMLEFNDTGVQKLADLLGTDAQNAIETIKGVVNTGKEYQSFAGKSDNMTGSVQFIYKTEEITK